MFGHVLDGNQLGLRHLEGVVDLAEPDVRRHRRLLDVHGLAGSAIGLGLGLGRLGRDGLPDAFVDRKRNLGVGRVILQKGVRMKGDQDGRLRQAEDLTVQMELLGLRTRERSGRPPAHEIDRSVRLDDLV